MIATYTEVSRYTNVGKKAQLVYFDTETGGLDASKVDLLTFGAVIVGIDGVVHERYAEVSLPEYRYDSRALEINGLNLDDMRETGMPEDEFFNFIDRIMSLDAIFVAHNFPFDEKFINSLYFKAGKPVPSFARNHLDTKSEAVAAIRRGLLDKKQKTNLKDLCTLFSIPTDGHHGALADSHMCRNLLHSIDKLYLTNPIAY